MTLRNLFVDPIESRSLLDPLSLFVRIALAAPFFLSGRTKVVEGSWLTISDTSYFLFENDYAALPPPPHFMAVAATVSEHLFPLLLLVGLATRFAAAALIMMTLVIQIYIYPDAWWNVHMGWIALGLAVIVIGPGRISADQLLFARDGG